MKKGRPQLISTPDALKIAEEYGLPTTKPTLISWCKKYKIGRKVGGRWKVSKVKLKLILEGKEWLSQEQEAEKRKNQ